MKKFYIPILAAIFLLSSFLSQGQVYNSITSNPGPTPYTLDDGRFWVGGIAPPNGCTGCTINVYADVAMVQNGFSSVAAYNCGGCTFLNDVSLFNSTINVFGNTTLSVNTYLQLFDVTVTLGSNGTDVETFFVNDQVDLDPTSSIRLANATTTVNSNNDEGNVVIGPHNDFTHSEHSAGIYYVPGGLIGGYPFSMILNSLGYGTGAGGANFNSTGYTLNCGIPVPTNVCALGIVYGPAITQPDGTFGVVFAQSTPLPVVLVQFIAIKNDDGTIKLNWATSQEQNSSHYEIQRSGNQTDWVSLGSVKAKGYSSTTSNYTFTDKSPLDGKGYYRLKMIDLDAKYAYSPTISVSSVNNSRALVIYNNPFSDMIRTKVNLSRAQNLVLTVSDMVGKTYISQNYHAQAGDNYINLQPNVGSRGMYILRIHGDSYDQTVKVEKQ